MIRGEFCCEEGDYGGVGNQMHHGSSQAEDGVRIVALSQHTVATSPSERLIGKIRVIIEAAQSSKRRRRR